MKKAYQSMLRAALFGACVANSAVVQEGAHKYEIKHESGAMFKSRIFSEGEAYDFAMDVLFRDQRPNTGGRQLHDVMYRSKCYYPETGNDCNDCGFEWEPCMAKFACNNPGNEWECENRCSSPESKKQCKAKLKEKEAKRKSGAAACNPQGAGDCSSCVKYGVKVFNKCYDCNNPSDEDDCKQCESPELIEKCKQNLA